LYKQDKKDPLTKLTDGYQKKLNRAESTKEYLEKKLNLLLKRRNNILKRLKILIFLWIT